MKNFCCSRREMLGRLGGGIGSVALLELMSRKGMLADTGSAKNPLAPKAQMLPAKAKAVISIFCYGGVSQVDTFDPKPELFKRQGEKMTGVGNVVATMGTPGGLMPSPWSFKKYGQCGMEISELFPNVAQHADDLSLIRSMNALSPAHGPALFQMNTGTILAGAPSVGSWVTYGLGTENENLPGYIVFTDNRGGPINGAPNWGNGYMPAAYQGTQFRSSGPPIVDLEAAGQPHRRRATGMAQVPQQAERAASGAQSAGQRAFGAHLQLRTRVQDADTRHRGHRHRQGDGCHTRAVRYR